jgi:MscS family membrane protein
MEKPFVINDWVQTPSVEGIVEDISFRSTRFRTFKQALVTVPNSTLANEPITNWSQMGKRRLDFYIGLTYNTTRDKMEKVVERIDKMLHEHPGIYTDQRMVYFEKFNESSLDIIVYCFTQTTIWSEYMAVREDINLKIMQIAEEENVSMAFPTRSLFMEKLPEKNA